MPLFIDKETILANIPQDKIFEKYGAPVREGMFVSPLRNDKHPTCSFYTKNGKLYMRDFSGHFWGDCFDYVQKMYRVRYGDALQTIARDFGLVDGTVREAVKPPPLSFEKNETQIRVRRKEWSLETSQYWKDHKITKATVDKFKTYPVETVWLNGNPVYTYQPTQPAYVYHWTGYDYQVYFPFFKERRFLVSKGGLVHGFEQLPLQGDLCIITKSRKDIMCLNEFGIPAIAPVGETVILDKDIIDVVKGRFTNVVSLMDYDNTGIHNAWTLRKQYEIPALFLTEGIWKRKQGYTGAKDFADFCKMNSINQINNLISHVKRISAC